jgi:hypothetical protein
MEMKPRGSFVRILSLFALLVLGWAGGCATTKDEYSDQPWNQPQSWEGVIPLPNMDGRR